jgi:hypothetical protein
MFVYTGRFQPYHRGHHDVVSRLITRDPTLFVNESDRIYTRYPVQSLYVCVAGKSVDKSNPLSVAQRRRLIQVAIDSDEELKAVRHLVHTEPMPMADKVSAEHAVLLQQLPGPGTPFFVSGNPNTVTEDHDSNIPCLQIENRDDTQERSATKFRDLIVEGTAAAMNQVRKGLPKGVYEAMEKEGLFERIRMIHKGG